MGAARSLLLLLLFAVSPCYAQFTEPGGKADGDADDDATPTPAYTDIAYGPHERHRMDLYLAPPGDPAMPTPLVLFFHGGQFITGHKSDTGTLDIRALLGNGISVASIDYRFTMDDPFPAPFDDAVRAVQFLRLYAEQINIDPERIAGHGEEAGGNLALYLALHDDRAEKPDEKDTQDPGRNNDREADEALPDILKPRDESGRPAGVGADPGPEPWEHPDLKTMSTRLTCAVARHPIATFDPRAWDRLKLPMNDHERLMRKYLAVRYLQPVDDPDVIRLVEDVSPLSLVSRDDPELLLMSQYPDDPLADNTVWTIVRHHPRQSELIAKAMRSAGNKATVRFRGMRNDPGTTAVEFLSEKLK